MQASDAGKLHELGSDNSNLKKLLAEAHLDIHALKGVFGVRRYPYRSILSQNYLHKVSILDLRKHIKTSI